MGEQAVDSSSLSVCEECALLGDVTTATEVEMAKKASDTKNTAGKSESMSDDAAERFAAAGEPLQSAGATSQDPSDGDSEQEARIRRRAYELWEEAGSPESHTDEYWHRAKEEISDRESQGGEQGGVK